MPHAAAASLIQRCATRRDRLRQRLRDAGLDALLVTYAANRYFLSGFELHDGQCNESAGMLLVTAAGPDFLLTDPRFKDAALRLWPEADLFIYQGQAREQIRAFLAERLAECASHEAGSLAVEGRAMSVDDFQYYGQTLALAPTHGHVEALRLHKDADEIAAMRRSCALNHAAFAKVPEFLVPGRTEAAVAWDIEKLYREHGATGLAFPTIVAAGPNAALPHAIPGETRIPENGCVLVDMGCRVDDYCSDQTRTFWVGDAPSKAFTETLELTQRAQAAGIAAVQPGAAIKDAYAAARDFFAEHGVAEAFTHGLGHGVGLETHEGPSLSPRGQGVFEPGMVVTVEPGLYYPAWGGVRWEHMLLVTEEGHEIF